MTTLNISDSDYFCTWVTTHNLHCLANQSKHARGRGLWSSLPGKHKCKSASRTRRLTQGRHRSRNRMRSGDPKSGLARIEIPHHPTLKEGQGWLRQTAQNSGAWAADLAGPALVGGRRDCGNAWDQRLASNPARGLSSHPHVYILQVESIVHGAELARPETPIPAAAFHKLGRITWRTPFPCITDNLELETKVSTGRNGNSYNTGPISQASSLILSRVAEDTPRQHGQGWSQKETERRENTCTTPRHTCPDFPPGPSPGNQAGPSRSSFSVPALAM